MNISLFAQRAIRYLYRMRDNVTGVAKLKSSIDNANYYVKRMELMGHLLSDTTPGVTSHRYADHDIIVSLTTYGKRIYDVALTIESIMLQTVLPNRIVLWLDEGFRGKKLPEMLCRLQNRGLEIEYCEDIRSYKKLIPALLKYPDDAIVTLDDDLLYDYTLLERLIMSYQNDPSYIYGSRIRRIALNRRGGVRSYSYWKVCLGESDVSPLNLATTGAGTLFPPHSLDDEVTRKEVFMAICPYADDIWIKAMSLKKGTMCMKACGGSPTGQDYIENPNVQDMGLFHVNLGKRMNYKQFHEVFSKYDLYKKLIEI